MKTPIRRLFLPLLFLTVCATPSCSPSSDKELAALEEQRAEWTARMNEEFPQRSSDTVELWRRLEHFRSKGNLVGQHSMLRALGNSARNSSLFGLAIEHHTAALSIAYEIVDTVSITTLLNELGTDFRRTGAYEEAMKYHYQSLAMSEHYGGRDTTTITRNIASSWNGIGVVYSAMNEPVEAARSYGNALQIEIGRQNYLGMAMNYANIGSVYLREGDYERAMDNFRLSLENNEKINSTRGIGLCNYHIGTVYEMQGDRQKALAQYLKAYDILEGPDTWHWVKACFSIGETYMSLGDHRRAKPYLDDGLKAAIDINAPGYIEQAYALMSHYYFDMGEYRRSAEELRRSAAWGDTVRNNIEAIRLLEPRIQYETGRYIRRIEQLDEANREHRIRQQYGLVIVVLVILLSAGLATMLYQKLRSKHKQAEDLKNLDRMRSNFFANITHEFRTPLTIMNGLADALRSKYKDRIDPGDAENLDTIYRQGDHLFRLVNQLLAFSRSEAGMERQKWCRGDIAAFLRMVTDSHVQYARKENIDLAIYCETDSLVMNYVPSSMTMVMNNLLSNAVRHCPSGSRVMVHMRREGNRCVIRVRDNGNGIAPEDLPHIFNLYYTSRSGDDGTGIGLSLTRRLVESMDGSISVQSTPGKGAEFIIRLPVRLDEIPECEREASGEYSLPAGTMKTDDTAGHEACDDPDAAAQSTLQEAAGDGKPVILVVEDNRDMAQYTSTVLGDRYNMLYAANGVEGLKMAEEHIPDLIITDVMMPLKDGCALTADIRASVATSHIPVIMVTAKDTTEDKLEGLGAGADLYLHKPFDTRELLAHIRQLLESRARLREKYSQALSDMSNTTVAADGADPSEAFMTKLNMAIHLHLDDDSYYPDGLAREMCLSVSQLYRKIKAMSGETVSSLVMRARLNRARVMLSGGDVNIKEVAMACGFDDSSFFARCFKNEYGENPSEFLKRHKQ